LRNLYAVVRYSSSMDDYCVEELGSRAECEVKSLIPRLMLNWVLTTTTGCEILLTVGGVA
jgi:hypothetical protein